MSPRAAEFGERIDDEAATTMESLIVRRIDYLSYVDSSPSTVEGLALAGRWVIRQLARELGMLVDEIEKYKFFDLSLREQARVVLEAKQEYLQRTTSKVLK